MLRQSSVNSIGVCCELPAALFASTKIVQLTNEFDELVMIFFKLNSGDKAGHLFAFFRGHGPTPENVGLVNWRN
jgi:hypothetical protein